MAYTNEQLVQLGQLNDLISQDPEAREALQRHLLRIGKARNLPISFPELEAREAAAAAAREQLKSYEEKLALLEAKTQEREAAQNLEAKRASIRALGATPAEIEAVEKLMVDRSMYFENYADALEYYRYKARPLTPSGANASAFARRYPGETDPKEVVLKDPEMLKPRSKKLKEYLDAEYEKAFREATAQTGGKLAFW